MKKITVITTEKHEIWVVRRGSDSTEPVPDETVEVSNDDSPPRVARDDSTQELSEQGRQNVRHATQSVDSELLDFGVRGADEGQNP